MAFEFDMSGFDSDLQKNLRQGREAFEGKYKNELEGLIGLSRGDIDGLTPDGTDVAAYDALIAIVKDASQKNLAQAALKAHIEKLGAIGIEIAKKVPALASIVT